eukprot:TRINITY_DN2267_c0_g1_i2.p1 TRINITY_DN2267_c0_g1~~TRINITY_DN2267_c0_g1_i2.p1  ORF type:complete len:476 (-),score=46.98 TRINITY_DN2267_c0_g1_i2:55-1482(-)
MSSLLIRKHTTNFVDLGRFVISSRFTNSSLIDFEGNCVQGTNFDLGVWDNYFDYMYSNYTGLLPDGENPADAGIPPQPGTNVGWDISHARRFCHFFFTFDECRDYLLSSFPNEILVGLTNQVIYRVFNKNFTFPLFTNFMDGTNGWYRVNYNGRPHFGYPPYGLTTSYPTGGYGFWAMYNQHTSEVMQSLWAAMTLPYTWDDASVEGVRLYLSTGATWVENGGIQGGGILVELVQKVSFEVAQFGEHGATIALWVNLKNAEGDADILTAWQGNGYTDFILLRRLQSGELCIDVERNDTTVVYTCSTQLLSIGQWHHIAILSNTSHNLIYVNGSVWPSGGTNCGTFVPQWNTNVQVWAGSTHWKYINGTLDDVSLFNSPLAPSTIKSLFQMTKRPQDIDTVIASWSFTQEVHSKDPTVEQFWNHYYGITQTSLSGLMFLPTMAQLSSLNAGMRSVPSGEVLSVCILAILTYFEFYN